MSDILKKVICGWPVCPVCNVGHKPKRLTNGGRPRCYHCGQVENKCECIFIKQNITEV